MAGRNDSDDKEPSSGLNSGRLLMVAVLGLALAATAALVLTDSARWLRMGVLAGLWAALLGVFLAARYRKQVADRETEAADRQSVYELELEREVAARREFELVVEAEARRKADEAGHDDLRELRAELRALRENLERLTGGEVLVERFALQAQSTRMRTLADGQPRMMSAGGQELRRSIVAGPPAREPATELIAHPDGPGRPEPSDRRESPRRDGVRPAGQRPEPSRPRFLRDGVVVDAAGDEPVSAGTQTGARAVRPGRSDTRSRVAAVGVPASVDGRADEPESAPYPIRPPRSRAQRQPPTQRNRPIQTAADDSLIGVPPVDRHATDDRLPGRPGGPIGVQGRPGQPSTDRTRQDQRPVRPPADVEEPVLSARPIGRDGMGRDGFGRDGMGRAGLGRAESSGYRDAAVHPMEATGHRFDVPDRAGHRADGPGHHADGPSHRSDGPGRPDGYGANTSAHRAPVDRPVDEPGGRRRIAEPQANRVETSAHRAPVDRPVEEFGGGRRRIAEPPADHADVDRSGYRAPVERYGEEPTGGRRRIAEPRAERAAERPSATRSDLAGVGANGAGRGRAPQETVVRQPVQRETAHDPGSRDAPGGRHGPAGDRSDRRDSARDAGGWQSGEPEGPPSRHLDPETSGAHAAGMSVTELLAAHGGQDNPGGRRRRAD